MAIHKIMTVGDFQAYLPSEAQQLYTLSCSQGFSTIYQGGSEIISEMKNEDVMHLPPSVFYSIVPGARDTK